MNNILFSDIDLRFDRHPESGDIFRLTNEASIKNSLKNILMRNFSDVAFDPTKGSPIPSLLFEDFSLATKLALEQSIKLIVHQEDSRITIDSVEIENDLMNHKLDINVFYYTSYSDDLKTFSHILRRTR